MRKTPAPQTLKGLFIVLAGCAATKAPAGVNADVLDRADRAFARGDLGETLSLLHGNVRDSARGCILLGRAQLELGESAEARASFARAVALDPHSLEAWRLHAEACERERFFERAIDSYNRVLEIRPEDRVAARQLAILLADLGRDAEAAEALRSAARVLPEDLDLRRRLGVVELRRGRNEEAEAAFTLFLERAGPEPAALQGRAIARARRATKLEEAESDLVQAGELARDDPAPAYNLGWVREERRDVAGAERAYRDALARRVDHFPSLCRLASILEARGDKQEALALYRQAAAATVNPLEKRAVEARIAELSETVAPASKPR